MATWTKLYGAGPFHLVEHNVAADHIAESKRLVELGLPVLMQTRIGPAESSFHHAPSLGHIIEVQRDAEFVRAFFAQMRAEADGWDGSDPLRIEPR